MDGVRDPGPKDLTARPFPVTDAVPRGVPGGGALDLCEEEMEQSVFGQESTLIPMIKP